MVSVPAPNLSVYIFAMSADNYELDQVKTLKFFRLNWPGDKVTITQLAGLLPISQTLALIVKLTRHEPVNRARTHYRLTRDGQIIDNQAICCDYRSHHQQCAHNEWSGGPGICCDKNIARAKNVLNPETEYNARVETLIKFTLTPLRVRHWFISSHCSWLLSFCHESDDDNH